METEKIPMPRTPEGILPYLDTFHRLLLIRRLGYRLRRHDNEQLQRLRAFFTSRRERDGRWVDERVVVAIDREAMIWTLTRRSPARVREIGLWTLDIEARHVPAEGASVGIAIRGLSADEWFRFQCRVALRAESGRSGVLAIRGPILADPERHALEIAGGSTE